MDEEKTLFVVPDVEKLRDQDYPYVMNIFHKFVVPGMNAGMRAAFEKGAIVLDITVPSDKKEDVRIEVVEPKTVELLKLLAAWKGVGTVVDLSEIKPMTLFLLLKREGEPARLGSVELTQIS